MQNLEHFCSHVSKRKEKGRSIFSEDTPERASSLIFVKSRETHFKGERLPEDDASESETSLGSENARADVDVDMRLKLLDTELVRECRPLC